MIVYEDDEPFDDAMIPYMSFEHRQPDISGIKTETCRVLPQLKSSIDQKEYRGRKTE
jgi:hypothetical protein